MYGKIKDHLLTELKNIREAGLYKNERIIVSPQDAVIKLDSGKEVLNFCANNYLGLSNHPELVKAAKEGLDTHGYGMSSVRFICGTTDLHKQLEEKVAGFFGTDDTILYAACFDANGGLFESLLSEQDAIISDSLNHASIIDGVRLCKAKRYRLITLTWLILKSSCRRLRMHDLGLLPLTVFSRWTEMLRPLMKLYGWPVNTTL
jgi:glycine C-acetyltransferase